MTYEVASLISMTAGCDKQNFDAEVAFKSDQGVRPAKSRKLPAWISGCKRAQNRLNC